MTDHCDSSLSHEIASRERRPLFRPPVGNSVVAWALALVASIGWWYLALSGAGESPSFLVMLLMPTVLMAQAVKSATWIAGKVAAGRRRAPLLATPALIAALIAAMVVGTWVVLVATGGPMRGGKLIGAVFVGLLTLAALAAATRNGWAGDGERA